MNRNPAIPRIRPIFEGADNKHYTLPSEVLARRTALGRLMTAQREAQVSYGAVSVAEIHGALVHDLPEQAMSDDLSGDWVLDLLRATADRERLVLQVNVLDEVVERGERLLVSTVNQWSDDILALHLRPVLETVIAKVREVVGVVPDTFWTQPGLLAKASDEVRAAYVLVEEQSIHYAAIRRAQTALQMVTGDPDGDAHRLFGEIANLPTLWPNYAYRQVSNAPPWPEDPLARLIWLARPEVETWMPTSIECQERWDAHGRDGALRPRIAAMPVSATAGG